MRYVGGKHFIATEIAMQLGKGDALYEPFCGGCSVTVAAAIRFNTIYANDGSLALISMWRALQSGWDPPNSVSEDEFYAAKKLPDTDPLKAFAGFGCSWGGKYFEGYGRSSAGIPAVQTRNSLLRQRPLLNNVVFSCMDYTDFFLKIPDGSTVYCDPPYNTGSYAYDMIQFNQYHFINCVKHLANRGCKVFVSEVHFPIGRVVWSKEKRGLMRFGKNRIESLYLVE